MDQKLNKQRNEIFRTLVVLSAFGAACLFITGVTAYMTVNLNGPWRLVDSPFWSSLAPWFIVTLGTTFGGILFVWWIVSILRAKKL